MRFTDLSKVPRAAIIFFSGPLVIADVSRLYLSDAQEQKPVPKVGGSGEKGRGSKEEKNALAAKMLKFT